MTQKLLALLMVLMLALACLGVASAVQTPWGELQAMINSAADGAEIDLDQNIVARPTEAALVVPAGKSVTIDLNGYSINRNLSAAALDGHVIRVEGALTVVDSEKPAKDIGTNAIRGGWTTGNGGGLYVAKGGVLTLNGVRVEGNQATGEKSLGGGIYVA